MNRIVFAIAIFALSFVVTSQLLTVFRDEATWVTWVVLFLGIFGFLGMLQYRARNTPRR
ncbi:MAG: hypothetical protein Q4G46_11175 [Propionibacteriaceae bacterium]|nr:hypothetical protein [Propionibacteriaceae bacterium]